MTIRDILQNKGSDVVTVTPGRTVLEAMRLLMRHRIGALVVMAGEEIRGIVTERDVLRIGAEDPAALATTLVEGAMTADLVVGLAEDDLDYVMGVMTRNRIRHLPIVHDGRLAGIVSIGDVVNACRSSVEAENRYLRDYILGVSG